MLIHEPVLSVTAMIEHSIVRCERERAEANRYALAANGWRERITAYFDGAILITLMLGRMAEICE